MTGRTVAWLLLLLGSLAPALAWFPTGSRLRSGVPRLQAAPDGMAFTTIEICSGSSSKDCKRRGCKKTLAYFEELGESTDFEIVSSECMDECTSGPNIRMDNDDKRIFGGIRSKAQVAEILGVELTE